MNTAEMTAKIAQGNGFIAALDQSGGSTPKALKGYGVEGEFRCENRTPREPSFELHAAAELFAQLFAMRFEIDRLKSGD